MIKLIRTDSKNPDFMALVKLLNSYLKTVDGEDHDFYMQYNGIEHLNHVVVAYEDENPVSCGSFKEFSENTVEIKRMFTVPQYRGKGFAAKVLKELETWSKEIKYQSCVLETGKQQLEAVSFYKKMNYDVIPNFGQYQGVDNSLCFKKNIS